MSAEFETALVSSFVALSTERHERLQKREIKKANKIYDRLYKVVGRQIRSLPDRGAAALYTLVEDARPEVRLNAAYLLLPLDDRLALTVLDALTKSGLPWIASTAGVTAAEWKSGRLDVTWFMTP